MQVKRHFMISLDSNLQHDFKVTCAIQDREMSEVISELIEGFIKKHCEQLRPVYCKAY